mgnify:CR=1 FL=1
MTHYDYWIFGFSAFTAITELYICWILTAEYYYDFNKDIKKAQKKTKTSKKTTQSKDGGTTVEESVEVTEPMSPGSPQGEGQ